MCSLVLCRHLEDSFVPLLFVLHMPAVHNCGTTPGSERSLGADIVVVMADALYDYVLTLTSDIVVDDDIVLVRLGTLPSCEFKGSQDWMNCK